MPAKFTLLKGKQSLTNPDMAQLLNHLAAVHVAKKTQLLVCQYVIHANMMHVINLDDYLSKIQKNVLCFLFKKVLIGT